MIARLQLGTLHLARLDPPTAFSVLDGFVAGGGRHIDTAAFYGDTYVESLLGRWMRSRHPDVEVTTKVGHFASPSDYRDEVAIARAVERSCSRLGATPRVVLLHDADQPEWTGRLDRGAQTFPAWAIMRDLAERYGFETGVSGNHADKLVRVISEVHPSTVLVAKQYDVLWRDAEVVLDQPNVQVTLGAPFHQGRLFDLPRLACTAAAMGNPSLERSARTLQAVLDAAGVAVADVALPFVLAEPRAALVCAGVSSLPELDVLLRSAERDLPDTVRAALSSLGVRAPPGPGPALSPGYVVDDSRWTALGSFPVGRPSPEHPLERTP